MRATGRPPTPPHADTLVRVEQIYRNTYGTGKITGRTTPVSGIGDEAYLDKTNARYVRTTTNSLHIEVVRSNGATDPPAERRVASEVLAHF
jgi:hypothetical protein